MRPIICSSLIALTTLGPGLALADVLSAPHLDIVPRTAQEASRIQQVTRPTTDFSAASQFEALSAGAATVAAQGDRTAFKMPARTLVDPQDLDFALGEAMFQKLWVSAPSSTKASDGLGPLFNARACQTCHPGNGRGRPPAPGDTTVSMFLKVSIPADPTHEMHQIEGYLAIRPDPTYGHQMQDFSTPGQQAEYRLNVTYDEIVVPLSDDEVAHLRKPTYAATELAFGPLHPDAMLSPRVGPQMIGLGLLGAIPAADILALADPDDSDGNGISGRPNIVWSVEYNQPMLGRFGHKATAPTVRQQSAIAFSSDMGLSTPLFTAAWGDCTPAQAACRAGPHGDGDARIHEVDETGLDLVELYSANLGVPERRDVNDPQVLAGKQVFYQTGCTACHQPAFVTHRLTNRPEHSFQLIWPYTDLLLHDMGEGLADHRPEARATGREWRTPPLWGIGLTQQVTGHSNFLHDGRARNLLEAVLWHGGEAQEMRDAVVQMSAQDRAALIRFLESL